MLFNLFTLGQGDLYPNRLAHHVLKRRRLFYENILSGKTTFRAEVERWLGIPAKDDLRATAVLERFYREHKDKTLDEEQQANLRRQIIQLYLDAGFTEPQRKRCEQLGPTALSNRLRSLNVPYIVEDTGGGWIIRQKAISTAE